MKTFSLRGPSAAKEVPALAELVANQKTPRAIRRQAAMMLGRIGPEAKTSVPVLVGLLRENRRSDPEGPALWGLKALALIGPTAVKAVDDVIPIVENTKEPQLLRMAGLEALAKIGTNDPRSLVVMIRVLRSSAPVAESESPFDRLQLRVTAAELLAIYGKTALPAVPELIRATRDKAEVLRRAAVSTLGMIGSDAAIDPLWNVLVFDDSEAVRDAAAVSLSRLGDRAENLLVDLLEDSDAEVRWRAADALRRRQRLGPSAQAALKQKLSDKVGRVRLHAARALWSAAKTPDLVLEPLLGLLQDEDRQLRREAYRTLLEIGQQGQQERARLMLSLAPLLKDQRSEVRTAATKLARALDASQEAAP